MGGRRIAAIALSGALVAGGTGAAIAAVTKDDNKKAEQAVLADAAKRLDVTPDKLRDALAAAQDAQLDQAVKDKLLTQEQADAIKAKRKASGSVLGGPLGGPRFHGKPHLFGGRGHHGARAVKHDLLGAVAEALGTTRAKLFEQLRAGKSIADVAKAQRKSLDSVRSAVKAATKTRLDKAVKDGDMTRKQADKIAEHLDKGVEDIGSRRGLLPRRHRHLRGALPPAPELRPGGLLPGEGAPELEPPPAVFS